jgi:DNA-binding MarR family transcriptional regulator
MSRPASRHTLITELQDLLCSVASAHASTVVPPESWLEADLTMPQVKAMLVLYHRGSVRIGNVANELRMSKNAATVLLDRLEALRFAERQPDPSDRRAVLVTLTEAGMQFVGDILSAGSASVVRFLEQMSTDDLHALHRGMAALAALITAEAGAQRACPVPTPVGSEA